MSQETAPRRSWLWRFGNVATVVLFIYASWLILAASLCLGVLSIGVKMAAFHDFMIEAGWFRSGTADVFSAAMFAVLSAAFVLATIRVKLFVESLLFAPADNPATIGNRPRLVSKPEHEIVKTAPSPQEIERRGYARGR